MFRTFLRNFPLLVVLTLCPSVHAEEVTKEVSTLTIRYLTPLDYMVIVLYFAAIIFISWLVTRKPEGRDFLLAGRNIPWWAAGISLYAAGTSAISFMAIPAKTYATDWTYYCVNVFQVAGFALIAWLIIPPIHRLGLTSTYEYLEQRFNRALRLVGSAIFIVAQVVGRNSVILLLPSLALSTVAGLDVRLSILVMGVVTIVYTAKGGFKAVIWTEVIQFFVLTGAVAVGLVMIVGKVDGGLPKIWTIAHEHGRTKLFDWSWSLAGNGVWIFLIYEIIQALTWIRDQSQAQRVFSTSDVKAAVRSVWTLNLIVIPGSLMFFGLGTALFAFYQTHPERLAPGLANDVIFPFFVAQEMPSGLVGLIFAGLCAATMSTLSGSVNSISTALIVDFLPLVCPHASEELKRKLNKWFTVIVGAVGAVIALILAEFKVPSLFDTYLILIGIIGSGFGGVFALGLFTRRTNSAGAIVGAVSSILLTGLFTLYIPANPYVYASIAVLSCMLIGWVASLFIGHRPQKLSGLTVFD